MMCLGKNGINVQASWTIWLPEWHYAWIHPPVGSLQVDQKNHDVEYGFWHNDKIIGHAK